MSVPSDVRSDVASRRAGRSAAPRRIRHEARDGLSVAALSFAASVGVTFAFWALLQWLA